MKETTTTTAFVVVAAITLVFAPRTAAAADSPGWLDNEQQQQQQQQPTQQQKPNTSKSVKITLEANDPDGQQTPSNPRARSPSDTPANANANANANAPNADHAAQDEAKHDALSESHFLHGFRLGYSYVANYDKPSASLDGKSLKEAVNLRSPHNFLIGYEVLVRMMGHSWLNVILLANGIIGGLEQSKVLPSGNALIGFELNNSFQLGVGAHVTPLKGQEAHVAFAAGWTPRVGNFYVPVHVFFIPDVDGNARTGMLSGVTW